METYHDSLQRTSTLVAKIYKVLAVFVLACAIISKVVHCMNILRNSGFDVESSFIHFFVNHVDIMFKTIIVLEFLHVTYLDMYFVQM